MWNKIIFQKLFRLIFNLLKRDLKNEGRFLSFANSYNEFQDNIAKLVLPYGLDRESVETRNGCQSRVFVIDILPYLWRVLYKYPFGSTISLCDVGPGSGYGTELIGALHKGFLGWKINVTAVDIKDSYSLYKQLFHRYYEFRMQDIFSETMKNESFDFVYCSHVIEHVKEPRRFVSRLQELCKDTVFLVAPYKENGEMITPGHINIFDQTFINLLQPREVHLIESQAWGAFLSPRYKMFLALLDGHKK